jgi:signal transduction histidine kinase/PAS domain-containing protein
MPGAATPAVLARFLRERQAHILRSWQQCAQEVSQVRHLARPLLIDHIPTLLERIAEELDEAGGGRAPVLSESAANRHADTRLTAGVDLAQVVKEYSLLRDCLLQLWRAQDAGPDDTEALRVLNRAIDHAVETAAERYGKVRDEAVQALGRLSVASHTSEGDGFLNTSLQILMDSTGSIEAAVILLAEADCLRLRAATGAQAAVISGRSVPFGAGLAGRAVETRQSVLERSDGSDLKLLGLSQEPPRQRLVYSDPLLGEERPLGVIEVAGRQGAELSVQDRRLVDALADHVASALTQQGLRQQLQSTAEIVEHGDPMFALDRNWRFVMGNRAYETVAQTPRDDLFGRVLWEVFPAAADLSSKFWIEYHRAMEERVTVHFEEYYPPLDLWTDVTAHPTQEGGIAVFFRDISDRKHSEATLRLLDQAGRKLAQLLDVKQSLARLVEIVVPVLADACAIDIVRSDGTVELAAFHHRNPEKLTRLREWRLKAANEPAAIRRVIATGEAQLVSHISEQTLSELPGDAEHAEAKRSMGLRSLMVLPLAARGAILGAISFASDESKHVFTQTDLAYARELSARAAIAIDNARLYEQAQQAIRLREDLLAIVSHDLKSPLSAINLSTGILQRQARSSETDRQLPLLENIQRASRQMERLIGDLLDMASIQAGQLAVARGPQPAAALLQEAAALHQPIAAEKGLELQVNIRIDPELEVCCDRERVLQVLGNLLGNALKFTPPGGWIELAAEREGEYVRTAVRDSGPGISAQELPSIFDPYWSGRGHRRMGSGLGLFISKGIISAHRGEIGVDSTPGAGSEFYFTLPLEE